MQSSQRSAPPSPGDPFAADAPFRAEILGLERLSEAARALAREQQAVQDRPARTTPIADLNETSARELALDNTTLSAAVRAQQAISPASEWLLDNYYLIEEQVNAVRKDLPSEYGRDLPWLAAGAFAGYPRIWEAALALIAHTDAALDEDHVFAFMDAYQSEREPLTIGECWAIPIVLRAALVENLRRLSRRVVRTHLAERAADRWAERLILTAQDDPSSLRRMIEELEREIPEALPEFFIRLSQRLQGEDAGGDATSTWLERRLAAERIVLDEIVLEQQREQAADQVSIANSISSIRFLDAHDWNDFFERISLVERTLRDDPAGVYSRMDFTSRDRYRHALEAAAERCPASEIDVARTVVEMAAEALETAPEDPGAGHVGTYLIREGRYELERRIGYRPRTRERVYRRLLWNRGLLYGSALVGFTLIVLVALGTYAHLHGAGLALLTALLLIAATPASELAQSVVNRIAAAVFPPRTLPRLDYLRPISPAHRTLVVVPALLTSTSSTQEVIDQLEIAYLGNADPNIAFGLLGDLKARDTEHHADDGDIVAAAERGISLLNERYEAEHGRRPFHLFLRGRTYCQSEGQWMGWERKRGALVELCRLLRGSGPTTFTHRIGEQSFREGVTFVLTLDADTRLPREGAAKLISTIAHPLNRAVFDHGDARITTGYGLIQPRVSMTLTGANTSLFAWMHSGATGVDVYAGAVSDTYQDVFGEGSFTGKGIFEVAAFDSVLLDRFPECRLLSHDLIEGCFLRTGLASDIEVFDDYPSSYPAHAARLHRWVRGDWQTLPWIMPTVRDGRGRLVPNPLSSLHRWKIVDNLRRSLVAPSTLLLMSVGWLLLPQRSLTWPLILLGILVFPALFSLLDAVLSRPKHPRMTSARSIAEDFRRNLLQAAFALAILPHQAWQMVDAAVRAVWRMTVSKRGLLEWETASDAQRRLTGGLADHVRRMWPQALLGTALLVPAIVASPARLLPALPIAAFWLAGPVVAWWVSREAPPRLEEPLDERQRDELRRVAAKTWRYFDTFVVPHGHHLAPDNYQEDPNGEVAWRTSPTNVGLQLMSYLGAWDLGYITVTGLTARSSDTLAALAGLERYRGHFYNWYDIRTLDPLRPAYVSTVDSGNLAGALLVLRIGLLEASEAPLLGPQVLLGIRDSARLALADLVAARSELDPAAAALRDSLEQLARDAAHAEQPTNLGDWITTLNNLRSPADVAVRTLAEALPGTAHEPDSSGEPVVPSTPLECLWSSVADAAALVDEALSAITSLAPWSELLTDVPPSLSAGPPRELLSPLLEHVPSLVGLAEGLSETLAALDSHASSPDPLLSHWCSRVAEGIRSARPDCVDVLAQLRIDADIAREMWEHTDFSMLFDKRRMLFSIGFNTAEGRLDGSYYDMLASECRLASFLAIAKGDISQEHWFRLSRQITRVGRQPALVSWSASMFEYFMPLLLMRTWPGTLLDASYGAVLDRQMAYGAERGVPWGVSESAFNAKDASLVYQYQAFGVPGLGLKRGLSDDVVIAPYSCILALPLAADSVLSNLRALTNEGAEGRFGYFEAVDYTPGRVPAGESRAVVKAYFAHHQGMSFVALVNALTDNRMQERFHSDPMVRSTQLLLHERLPRHVLVTHPHVEEVRAVRSVRELPVPIARRYPTPDTLTPATHFLSNGRYSVMVTNAGSGYSRWKGLAVTRYREDITRDCWGTFIYVRDVESGRVFSVPHQPTPTPHDEYEVTFSPDKAEFRRVDGAIETRTEVVVSPEDDVEIRRLTLTNRGRDSVTLEVTSYFEIALTAQAADQAHKSFSNLFVETEPLAETNALLFSRRPRSASEPRYWGLHATACEAAEACDWSYETDRAAFIGRLRGVDVPLAVHTGGELAKTSGAVLDPACAIRRTVILGPGESSRIVFTTGVAEDRESAIRLTEKYHDVRSAQRAIDLAWTASQIELRDLAIRPEDAVTLQRLASRLLLTDPYSPLKVKTPAENGLQMSGLWSIGISGDLPILLVRIEQLEHAPLVRQALLAHQYWRHKGLTADLVILNTRPTSYADELDDRLRLLVRTGHALQLVDKPGGVFLRRADQMHPDVLNLLLTVARATLEGDGGSIELQLNRRGQRPDDPLPFVPTGEPRTYEQPEFTRPELSCDNGYGGFDPVTGEYVIVLEGTDATPAPWINVMATPEFGCLVSEAGVGCTWAKNSHENRITTWNNDAVTDGSGEAIYIRDEETGEFWSPTPLPVRTDAPYVIRHAPGLTTFEHTSHGIEHHLEWFVASDDPIRVCRLTLTNRSAHARRLSVTQFVEWVLGSSRSAAQHQVVTWFDGETDILTAHNHFNMDFPGRCAFLACDRRLHSFTGSRTEFVGRNRHPRNPIAMHRTELGGQTGRFHDNCGALMSRLSLGPGESVSISFLLGQTDTLEQARELVHAYRHPAAVDGALARVRSMWSDILDTVEARTPDKHLDMLVNGRLLYQSVACRLWGRTATYQSSGAFGFRDQLQDVLSLMLARPELVRQQIVEASRHQFEQGDVLHWWQPYSGRGVRTRISDDRHWMPFVVAEYIRVTGDTSVLHERTSFIEGPPLGEGQEDLYLQPTVSERAASVYEHCIAALESGRPTGAHGLPLIGGGDWNDGMNRVGHEGRGESVWLAWFLDVTLRAFAPICEHMGEAERADEYRAWAASLVEAIDREAWDGSWYRRAYFDDGTPLGSTESQECRIDAIAQAWATISGAGDPERAAEALDSVEEKLVRREDGLIALLSPPFDTMPHDPGYIKGYVPGVRENGGQYTHAATWVILAHLLRGDGDEALGLIDLINPIRHALTREDADRYKVEPYVVAADVYAAPPHVGRGGWTWYTGSASWFYRVIVRHLLGIDVVTEGGERFLVVDPCVPKTWDRYELVFRPSPDTSYRITVVNPRGVNRGVAHVDLDGSRLEGPRIPLAEDGREHEVTVTLLGG